MGQIGITILQKEMLILILDRMVLEQEIIHLLLTITALASRYIKEPMVVNIIIIVMETRHMCPKDIIINFCSEVNFTSLFF